MDLWCNVFQCFCEEVKEVVDDETIIETTCFCDCEDCDESQLIY